MKKDIAIKVEHLSKRYRIQAIKPGFTFVDALSQIGKPKPQTEDFWALKDVSFEVKQGEVLGVIGKNGSGKSTLLKILPRVTEPTEGKVTMRGRVASLLEVGTGFNPELSGRENIFLNGAILGMSRKEIAKKFDEIVDFAGVEKFIDTPVKRYSSGMYVRLAFAVAAHLDADILLVDEVLAVGDGEFQTKCLGKMNEITGYGKTVLFVSHNIHAIENICQKTLWINEGHRIGFGHNQNILHSYRKAITNPTTGNMRYFRDGRGNIHIKRISVSLDDMPLCAFKKISIKLMAINRYQVPVNARLALSLRDSEGSKLISCDSIIQEKTYEIQPQPTIELTCELNNAPLNSGAYEINVGIIVDGVTEDWIISAKTFYLSQKKFSNHRKIVPFPILGDFNWRVT